MPVVIDFVGAVKNTRDVLIPILWEFVNPKIEVFKPETRTLSSLFKSINGKNFPFTSLLLTQVNTISSNVLRFVLIEDTPRPTISLTSALKPVPFVPVLSKDVRSPTLYPVPGFNMVIFSTPPLDTDVTSVVCLMVSLDSIIKS